MKTFNNITLKFKTTGRDNYMSLSDLLQDVTTENLIELLPSVKKLSQQMDIMNEIEIRNELSDDQYFSLLETCNGI